MADAYRRSDPDQVSDPGPWVVRQLTFEPSTLGESPPPPLKACFGRDELIETITGLVEKLNPIALVGAGGIGKTSIALTILHHDRVEKLFGDNRRFIRCDQFPPSRTNFLRRLSEAIGAGIKNPEDLTPLRQFLSSKKLLIVLDNAESILDPQGPEGREIYGVVKELAQFTKICLVVTSRITTIPPDFKRLNVPTLSADAARSAFYRIHDTNERPDLIDAIVEQLDFHPLSVTLLATVAYQNNWNNTRLDKEWKKHRTTVLQTEHKESLAAAVELSLASPTFQKLGPAARELLGVVAFFPQGVHEDNLDWLFPTIPNRVTIFDKFSILSLTYRSNGFITMLVPLRDYFRPKDPLLSPLLRTAKESYFKRLSAELGPNLPGFEEARWIVSEDTNVEHLINVLIPIDKSDGVWNACDAFLRHLYWHKLRRTVLGPKIEELPDDHHFKPDCLSQLGQVLGSIGNPAEQKRLLGHVLKLERKRGNSPGVGRTLEYLSGANLKLGLYKEGIRQAEEALKTYEQIGAVGSQAELLLYLAWLLEGDNQLDAAEEAASRVIELLPKTGEEFSVCRAHRALGDIHCSKGEREKAIGQYETALGITSNFNWNGEPFRIHLALADLFRKEDRFEDAHFHIEKAKQHTAKGTYYMGHAALEQAHIFYQQRKLESATNEARCALDIFEEFSSPRGMKHCKDLLQDIEQAKSTSGELSSNSELLHAIQHPIPIDSPLADAHIGQCKYT